MFEQLGHPILQALGKGDAIVEFNQRFNNLGFWAVLGAGLTPFPYKVVTIMSGWTGMHLGTFIATSILARGLRFFIVAGFCGSLGRQFAALLKDGWDCCRSWLWCCSLEGFLW